jgi:hypothetical protein
MSKQAVDLISDRDLMTLAGIKEGSVGTALAKGIGSTIGKGIGKSVVNGAASEFGKGVVKNLQDKKKDVRIKVGQKDASLSPSGRRKTAGAKLTRAQRDVLMDEYRTGTNPYKYLLKNRW